MQTTNQLRSSRVSFTYVKKNEAVMEDLNVQPIRNINDSIHLNKNIKSYCNVKLPIHRNLNEFDSFCWPAIIKGNVFMFISA